MSTRNRKPQGYELPNGDYTLGSEEADKAWEKRRRRRQQRESRARRALAAKTNS